MKGCRGRKIGWAAAAAAAVLLGLAPGAGAQARHISQAFDEPGPLAVHGATQGYLGVDLADVDADKAQTLKLKEVRGALITLIDHDAPAGKIGLRVNDVILSLNGYAVQGAEQLRRMLHEIPSGRRISLVVSRDGAQQSLTVEMGDRKAIEQNAWNNIGQGGDVFAPPTMGILPGNGGGGGGDVPPSGFHMPIFSGSLNVGAMVEPLSSQMAEYMGVQGGIMVKQVARKSAAAAAGLKAFDVVVKVGTDAIDTTADWDRALRSNEGKTVQLTVLRDKKQQTLNLQVASRKRGALEMEWPFAPGFDEALLPGTDSDMDAMIAELLPVPDEELGRQAGKEAAAEAEAEAQKAGDEARKAADEMQKLFDGGNFPFSQQQMDEFRQQMDEFRQGFRAEDFKIDPKAMEELRKQMNELRKSLPDQKQMEQFRRQMDQFRREMENFAPAVPGRMV